MASNQVNLRRVVITVAMNVRTSNAENNCVSICPKTSLQKKPQLERGVWDKSSSSVVQHCVTAEPLLKVTVTRLLVTGAR